MSTVDLSRPIVRKKPRDKRAAATYDLILDTAAELLEEAGFDKLTTNLICKRAGITPPALYNYFPDKYAILQMLGQRLMASQDKIVSNWLAAMGTRKVTGADAAEMLLRHHEADKAQVGAKWIWRSLRSIPSIEHVLLESKQNVCKWSVDNFMQACPDADRSIVEVKHLVMVEIGTSILQMLIDDPQLDAEKVCRETGEIMASCLASIEI